MADTLYDKGRQAFLDGYISWSSDNIKAVLIDLDDYALIVEDATNTTPIEITTTGLHGLSTGDRVTISRVGGNTAANNTSSNQRWTVTVTGLDAFTLDDSVGNGAYTSGGHAIKVSLDDNLDDIPSGARVSTSSNLTGKTVTDGIADAEDTTFSAVTGDVCEAIVLYKDTGVASTSKLIAIIDSATGLPVTPNGGNIIVTWSDGVNKIFRL